MKKDLTYSFFGACGLHGVILFGMGLAISQSAEYGVAVGQSSMEVNLVAAPAMPMAETPQQETKTVDPEPPKEEEMVLPEPVKETPQPPSPKPPEKPKLIAQAETAKIHGDGSSSQAGQDATTVQSSGGAQSDAKPGYLNNPPPPYPEKARLSGQQGVVLLLVHVNPRGEAESVRVKESSRYKLLDEAAVKAVRYWKFSPAKIAGLSVMSQVDIPIRFQIE